ncbi:MAG: tetratricopeptide repeat protein [Longimicrobiales bacterium]
MKGYTTRDVASLLGLTEGQIRSYARSGFFTPARGPQNEYRFDFQDLVLLRTAAALVRARVPARKITTALAKLRDELPQGRSLTELRITAIGEDIVVSDGGAPWEPESGQFHIDFQVADFATSVEPLARGAADRAEEAPGERSADEWYTLAIDLEAVSVVEAARAYIQAIELAPDHSDARVNLGRLFHEDGRLEDAEEQYRAALDSSENAFAAYNLGLILENRREIIEALSAYERAVAADPNLADAHFNLARLHEATGDARSAIRHFNAYRLLTQRKPGRR